MLSVGSSPSFVSRIKKVASIAMVKCFVVSCFDEAHVISSAIKKNNFGCYLGETRLNILSNLLKREVKCF